MKKRGSSDVKFTLIMVLAAVFLIGIFWVVLVNVFNSSPSEIINSLTNAKASIGIEKATLNGENISLTIKRNKGEGNLNSIIFLFSDGNNNETVKRDSNIKKLESNTFSFDTNNFKNISFTRQVSVKPIFSGSSGNESSEKFDDSKQFSDEEILKGIGAEDWWQFEDNINDEIGLSNGVNKGDLTFVEGKQGKAGKFNGIDNYVDFQDFNKLDNAKEFSISFWVYREEGSNFESNQGIISRGSKDMKTPWIFGYGGTRSIFAQFGTTESAADCGVATKPLDTGRWSNIILVWNGKSCMFYENSVLTNSDPTKGDALLQGDGNLLAGKTPNEEYFNGLIDNMVFFGKALDKKEVEVVYSIGS